MSGFESVPVPLIIQLPGIPSESIVARVVLSPRLVMLGILGSAELASATHERTCDGGVVSIEAGKILGEWPVGSAQ